MLKKFYWPILELSEMEKKQEKKTTELSKSTEWAQKWSMPKRIRAEKERQQNRWRRNGRDKKPRSLHGERNSFNCQSI